VAAADATFVMAKGGGAEVGPTKRGKGMKIMAIVDRHGSRQLGGETTVIRFGWDRAILKRQFDHGSR
jgi:hypothetical protein